MRLVFDNKKKIALLAAAVAVDTLALIIILLLIPDAKTSEREIFEYEDFRYAVLADGTAEIVSYTGSDKEVTVPDAIEGFFVSRIGSDAFRSSSVKSVTFGSFLKSIGSYLCLI